MLLDECFHNALGIGDQTVIDVLHGLGGQVDGLDAVAAVAGDGLVHDALGVLEGVAELLEGHLGVDTPGSSDVLSEVIVGALLVVQQGNEILVHAVLLLEQLLVLCDVVGILLFLGQLIEAVQEELGGGAAGALCGGQQLGLGGLIVPAGALHDLLDAGVDLLLVSGFLASSLVILLAGLLGSLFFFLFLGLASLSGQLLILLLQSGNALLQSNDSLLEVGVLLQKFKHLKILLSVNTVGILIA